MPAGLTVVGLLFAEGTSSSHAETVFGNRAPCAADSASKVADAKFGV